MTSSYNRVIATAPDVPLPAEKVAEVIDQAHDLLLSDGWCKGTAENARGEHCIVGALSAAAAGNMHLGRAVVRQVGNYVRDNGLGIHIPDFNDQPGTTLDEVLDVLRHASKELRA